MDLKLLVFLHELSNMNLIDCLMLANKSIINTSQSIRPRLAACDDCPLLVGLCNRSFLLIHFLRCFSYFFLAANGIMFDTR